MNRKVWLFLTLAVFFSMIFAVSDFADTAYLKDGRVIRGKMETETADYIMIFEPDTQWRVGLWKKLLSSVEVNGVVYDVKPGEMMHPTKQQLKPEESTSSEKKGASTSAVPRKGTIVVQEAPKSNKPADNPADKAK